MILRPSPNQSPRFGHKVRLIVVHYTGSINTESALSWFENPKSKASAHYVIGREGTVYQCVSEENTAYHAGVSEYKGMEVVSAKTGNKSINMVSIGIELSGHNAVEFTNEQYESLIGLCKDIKRKYKIEAIVGHDEIARPKGRKIDPGPLFDWDRLLKSL